ncbi:MAG: AtpZ/AtpI family protein [Selenomonadaceae bacterium]|nr:AtpZ/AtpI family protein [Selenomonadaceae bacterium]
MKKHEGMFQALKAFSFLSGIGIYIAVVVGCAIYIGKLFDDYFDASPYGIFGGILLGFPIAIYGIYRRIKGYL